MKAWIIFVLSTVCLIGTAKSGTSIEYNPIKLEGILKSDKYDPQEEAYAYVKLSRFGFARVEMARTEHQAYKEKLRGGRFCVELPAPSEICYMHILYKTSNEVSKLTEWIDRIFIVEAGDSLCVEMSENNMQFSGKGAEKMNCQTAIFRKCYQASDDDFILFKQGNYREYIDVYESKMRNAEMEQLAVIEQYADELHPTIVKLLKLNCAALRYSGIRQMNFYLRGNVNPEYSLALRKYYRKNRLNPRSLLVGAIEAETPLWCNYLLETEIFDFYIEKFRTDPANSDELIAYLYRRIWAGYSGSLRDKMLVLLFLHYNQNNLLSQYFDGVYSLLTDEYKGALVLRKSKLAKGSRFFDFELPDAAGKTVGLTDFSDKVVIVDFWYTGCPACLQLAAALKPVKQHFKDNKNVIFLTISIDRSKATWLKSLKDELYTDQQAINIYTGGSGKEHPLIKYYNITSYPTLYVLKDGCMYDAFPPKPIKGSAEKSNLGSRPLIDLIEKALSSSG